MARDTTPIGEDVVIGSNTPPVETTVEALIRAYNRLPLNTNLTTGDRMEWNGTAWVPVGKETSVTRKTTDQSVSSADTGTTLVNITDLPQAVEAGAVYSFRAYLPHTAGAAGDIKFGWAVPTGTTMSWGIHGNGNPILEAASTQSIAGDGTPNIVTLVGTIVVGGTAGDVAPQFAQFTADATASTVHANAHLELTKV